MTRRFMTGVLIVACLWSIAGKSYAWNQPPKVIIAPPDPKWVHLGYKVRLDGSGSYDPDWYFMCPGWGGPWPYEWKWWFGDGSPDEEGASFPPSDLLHEYPAVVATYMPTLTVWDCYGDPNSEWCTVHVVQVGLTAGSAYVCVNDDDDNTNCTIDKDPSEQQVYGETDLVVIQLSVQTPAPNDCKVKLMVGPREYRGAINIWSHSDKRQLLIPDPDNNNQYYKEWPVSGRHRYPDMVYVEGIGSTPLEAVGVGLEYIDPCGASVYPTDRVTFTVVKVSIYAGLSEQDELCPGKYINVNWDDDDNDGWQPNDNPPGGVYTGDKNDSEIPNGESDFRYFTVSISPQLGIVEEFPNSKVSITFPSNVKVWQTNTKKTILGESSELPSGGQFKVENLPKELYLEGYSGSSTFRDVQLKATWLPCSFDDLVKTTVFEVDLTGRFGYGSQAGDNSRKHSSFGGSSDKNGKISWDDANANGVKGDYDYNCLYFRNCMECQGTVEPSGVTTEVEFNFDRKCWRRTWISPDSTTWTRVLNYTNPWYPDEWTELDEDKTPSAIDRIYQIDGPGLDYRVRPPNYVAYIGDFKEWVMVKIDGSWYQCSDYYKWHAQIYTEPKYPSYTTRRAMTLQKLGGGWITVPANP